ncbi:M56 family metallopeptidase [Chryseobacterium turcicum]|uniref:M56 family metallopeptidase n=1 Tax=Chryseobacterium turcicum TaxID=2898076 RepID=A0A9Q3UXC9_9FLAO|nr:M56 family metallopeptidase [Chryseobacterium turcicum]MCD1115623.1 M56 family metallopeptidase [Chryseobacterium turcicum]
METIILKIILCSGVLLGLYHLFLAKEKTFVFNRFYLIFALIFSYTIPFVTIETQTKLIKKQTVFISEKAQQNVDYIAMPNAQESFDYTQLVLVVYGIVSLIFLLKFLFSLLKIKNIKGQKLKYRNRNIKLLLKKNAPFSFFNTIYVSKEYFKDEIIDESIFLHEEIHVKEKHSLDIIFVEILKIISWFNPFVYFYQKAITTNHEFLADKGVINTNKNIKDYQELILSEVLKQQNLALIQTFNFNNTKKRFIMMTKKNSKFAKTKMLLTIPVLAIAGFMFAEKTIKTIDLHEVKSQQENDGVSQLISDAPIVEYNQIIKKYSTFLDNHEYAKFERKVTVVDREKLSQLYKKLTDKQKDETALVFFEQKGKNVMGFKGQEVTLALRDTISPPKNKEAKLTDLKSVSDISEKKIAQDISTTAEGIAANVTPAEFPGGINELRKKLSYNFDTSSLQGNSELIRTDIFMTIDENGKAININAIGQNEKFNNEAVRVAKLLNENVTWVPAKKDGEPVRYQYKLPLAMQFAANK